MSKKQLYYSDVTHSCGHTVRYEFSLAKNAPRAKRIAHADELKRKAGEPCTQCEENTPVMADDSDVEEVEA
jgi:hypothetical protein